MFELAVPIEPIIIPPLQSYEEVRLAAYNIGLHWEEAGVAQLDNMNYLMQQVTTTITRRAGEGLSRFVISTPESPDGGNDPKSNHLELWPGNELKLFFSNDPNAYALNGRCAIVQNFASAGTWYLLATQRLNGGSTPYRAQAAYNMAITNWNGKKSQQRVMKEGAEAALLGLMQGMVVYLGGSSTSDITDKTQVTKNNQYLVNKVTIDWGQSIQHCLKEWQ